MKKAQIAAQLFTLREHLKTPEDIATSLKKVADIGYQAVQVSGMGPIPEEDLVKLCQDNGLTICSTHEKSAGIIENTDAVIERLQKLGCTHTAYPHPHVELDSEDAAKALAADLAKAGDKMRAAGITLSYHNHALEFRKFGGKTVLDILYDETTPEQLEAELDLYWVQMGGGSPLTWVNKVAGRQQVVHMKDAGVPVEERLAGFCEVGNGNLDWDQLIPALDATGCQWFVVEQDRCPADEFDSLKQSFEYLSSKADG